MVPRRPVLRIFTPSTDPRYEWVRGGAAACAARPRSCGRCRSRPCSSLSFAVVAPCLECGCLYRPPASLHFYLPSLLCLSLPPSKTELALLSFSASRRTAAVPSRLRARVLDPSWFLPLPPAASRGGWRRGFIRCWLAAAVAMGSDGGGRSRSRRRFIEATRWWWWPGRRCGRRGGRRGARRGGGTTTERQKEEEVP